MKTLFVSIVSIFILLILMAGSTAKGACVEGSDWPNAPCNDLPSWTPNKETLRQQWAPYYQYKGADWMAMMKTQMIDAIKNGTINNWKDNYDNAEYNVWTYYSLNDQVPFFISPGDRNYTKPNPILSPLEQFRSGTPVEDTQCKTNLRLWLEKDGTPACVQMQSAQNLLKRGFLLSDSYEQFAFNEAERFVHSSPTFESSGMENTLNLTVDLVEQSFPPIVQVRATFDSSIQGYGDMGRTVTNPHLTHHEMSITVSDTNRVTRAIIDKQWDEMHQKFLKE